MQKAGVLDIFSYVDFVGYMNGEYVYANFLYGLFVNAIDATSIGDPRLFTLGIITAVLIDILTLHLFSKYFLISFKTLLVYGVFSLHPYFSTYAWRFDTLDFASMSCILFLILLNYKLDMGKVISVLFLMLFLSMFRTSALVFWLAAFVAIYLIKNRLHFSKIEKYSIAVMLIVICLIVRQNGSAYLFGVANASVKYGWSLEGTRSIFGTFGYIFDVIIHYLFRIMTLLGGREAVYTEGIGSIIERKLGIYQLISIPILALLHFAGLVLFVRFSYRLGFVIPVLVSFIALVLALFTVGHMRYTLPYQPMILIGILYFSELKYFGKNCVNSSVSTEYDIK